MASRHSEERRQKRDDAYRRGYSDGHSEDIDSRTVYNDRPEERQAYVTGYIDGERAGERRKLDELNDRVLREREAREEELLKQAKQKHEERIDSLITAFEVFEDLRMNDNYNGYVEAKKNLHDILLELIPGP